MRVYVETDYGRTIEAGELKEAIPESGALILMSERFLSNDHAEALCKDVTAATGKPCIVLGPHIEKVLGV